MNNVSRKEPSWFRWPVEGALGEVIPSKSVKHHGQEFQESTLLRQLPYPVRAGHRKSLRRSVDAAEYRNPCLSKWARKI